MKRLHQHRASVGPIVRVFAVFALIHSVLASHPFKQLLNATGTRYQNGLYRLLYNALAVFMLVPLTLWFSRLPDRTLYRVQAPWSALFHAVQLMSIGFAVAAARAVGFGQISGIAAIIRLLQRKSPSPEIEAQGPSLQNKTLNVSGPFRITRHPLNLAPMGVFLFFPHMTVNRMTLAGLSLIYLYAGSLHEETRLRRAYGERYRDYQTSGISFYLPLARRQ